ncbi:MAG: trypsin-like peptidase domain-containing protein [Silvibacterium sp.]
MQAGIYPLSPSVRLAPAAISGRLYPAPIAASSKVDPKQVREELARHHLIKPIVTQGHIGDVLPDKIVYDAQTTSGGSGGPLFNDQGQVIGINFAMVRNFGGSNFAIPARFGDSLLKP